MKIEKKLNNLLADMEDQKKDEAKKVIEKAIQAEVKKAVKKKMKQKRKRFVRRVIVLGAVAGCGYLVYKKNETVRGKVDEFLGKAKDKDFRDKVKVIVVEKAEQIPQLLIKK